MSTHYSYYTVSGNSLPEIHRSIVEHAPSLNGLKGYGLTTALPGPQMSVAHCQASGHYQLGIAITEKLPRVSPSSGLLSGEMSQWNRFAAFVKKHEDTHRAIWRSCGAEFERKFLAGETGNCSTAHSRAMKLWREMVVSCMPKQMAFDVAQRSVLRAHPFMKYASR
jgi:predicted secreted Zn-dependent protease